MNVNKDFNGVGMANVLIGKLFVYLICLLAGSSAVLAADLTIEKLIDSYDYDFDTGVINVTTFSDYMIDQNGNGQNDTLVINLTTNAVNSSTYLFIVSLNEKAGLLRNYTNKTVSSSAPRALVAFDTEQLNLDRYNHSVEVRGQDYGLLYAKYKAQTGTYANFEKGVSVISISDQSIGGRLVRVVVNLNVTENKTTNVTLFLKYSNRSVYAANQVTLTTPSQAINFDFDNETVKSTHYNGVYSVDSVQVGEKLIATTYNTSSYNYVDFAKSSYIRNVSSAAFDNNSNNLSDALQFNFTLNITAADTYGLETALYTSDDEYVATVAKNVTLAAGVQTVPIEVAGKTVYAMYHNGRFKLSFAKLSVGNSAVDIVYDAHVTNVTSYADFERPPQPDLAVAITTSFFGAINATNITVNVTNKGSASAFNIIIDVFDNVTFENRTALPFLNVSETRLVNFSASNTANNSLFIAVADFDNLVDESNESNNVVDNLPPQVVSLKVVSLSQIHSNGTYKIFEFIVENNGSSAVSNVTWTLSMGDGALINSTRNASLAVGEKMRVYSDYNYSSEGSYTVTANASAVAEGVSHVRTLAVGIGTLTVSDLKALYSNLSEKVFEFAINNTADANASINWTINFGDGNTASSTQNANLNSSKSLLVYVQHNYASQGDYSVTATAQGGGSTASKSIAVEVEYLGVSNFSILNISGTERTFGVLVRNYMYVPMANVSWSLNTGNGIVSSTSPITLQPQESAFVFVTYNYTATGSFAVNFTAVNGSRNDIESLNVTIT